MLKNQSVEKIPINHILVQTKDVPINLVIDVSFLKKVFPKGHIVFQAPPPHFVVVVQITNIPLNVYFHFFHFQILYIYLFCTKMKK